MPSRPPSCPHQAALRELSQSLGLHGEAASELERLLPQAIEAVVANLEARRRQPSKEVRVRELKAALSGRDRLIYGLSSKAGYLRPLLHEKIVPEVGMLLSLGGMERLINHGVAFSLPMRDLDVSRYYDPGRADATMLLRVLEDASRTGLANVAWNYGPELLTNLVAFMTEPLRLQRELERADAGGRPEDLPRRLMLGMLVQIYPAVFGNAPTASKSARADCFQNFCQQVFETCGMDTEGLEPAVERFLTRRNALQARSPTRRKAAPPSRRPAPPSRKCRRALTTALPPGWI